MIAKKTMASCPLKAVAPRPRLRFQGEWTDEHLDALAEYLIARVLERRMQNERERDLLPESLDGSPN